MSGWVSIRALNASKRPIMSGSFCRSSASWLSSRSSAWRAGCDGLSRTSASQASASRWIRSITIRSTHCGDQRGARGPTMSATSVPVVPQPVVRLDQDQVEQRVVGAVLDHRLQEMPGDRAQRLPHEPRQQRPADERGHVVVAQPRQRRADRPGALGHDPLGVGAGGKPLAGPAAHLGGAHLLRHHLLGEEVLGDELLQALGQAVLAGRHDRGVRDRQPERSPEQRGDREPVRQRTDHRRLGRGVQVTPAAARGAGWPRRSRLRAAAAPTRPIASAATRAAEPGQRRSTSLSPYTDLTKSAVIRRSGDGLVEP